MSKSKPTIQQIIEFLKHPVFWEFMEETKLRISDYDRQLRKKDPEMNTVKYNDFDLIKTNIEILEWYLKNPATLLWSYFFQAKDDDKGKIQEAINYSLWLVGEEVLTAVESKEDSIEDIRNDYFDKMQEEINRLQLEELENRKNLGSPN